MVTVSWLDGSQTIILITYEPKFEWDDYDLADRAAASMMDSSPAPVDVLVDFERATPPLDYSEHMARIASISPYFNHPRAGHTVVASPNHFVEFMVLLFNRLFNPHRAQFHYASSLEEGLALIRRLRASP